MSSTYQSTVTVNRSASRLRQAARKVGIVIETPSLSLPEPEREETDIM